MEASKVTFFRKMENHCTSGLLCEQCVSSEVLESFAGTRKQTIAFRGNGWVRLTAQQARNATEVGNRCIGCGTGEVTK